MYSTPAEKARCTYRKECDPDIREDSSLAISGVHSWKPNAERRLGLVVHIMRMSFVFYFLAWFPLCAIKQTVVRVRRRLATDQFVVRGNGHYHQPALRRQSQLAVRAEGAKASRFTTP